MTRRHTTQPTLLALGGDPYLHSLSTDIYRISHVTHARFSTMTAQDFDDQSIHLVASVPFCDQTDCVEIGQHLDKIGFQGIYLIMVPPLPNPTLIERELRQLYPRLNFRVHTPDEVEHVLNIPIQAKDQ